MRKLLTLVLMIGAVFFLFTSSIQAAPFADESSNWANWGTVTGMSDDVIGQPDLIPNGTFGEASITSGGILTGVQIPYTNTDASSKAGDLFIDTGADGFWNYVVKAGANGKIYDLSSINLSADYAGGNATGDVYGAYILSNEDYDSFYRHNHPVRLIDHHLLPSFEIPGGYSTFTDFSIPSGFIEFSGFSLDVGSEDFIIGFGPTCANDVLYSTVTNPVPIPTSILLLGSGLVGLAGIKRRKR